MADKQYPKAFLDAQFKPGQVSNPGGRPKGIRDKRLVFRDMTVSRGKEIFEKAIQMALDGNEHMLKTFLDRLLPTKYKDNFLPECFKASDLDAKNCDRIKEKLADGEITPSEAVDLMKVVETAAKIEELDAIKKEIADIKAMLTNSSVNTYQTRLEEDTQNAVEKRQEQENN